MKKRKLTPKEMYRENTAGTPDYIYVMGISLLVFIVLIAVTWFMVNVLGFVVTTW